MKLLFLDIETTGLEPERIVWQTVYAKAVQEGQTLRVLEVAEFVGRECIRKGKVKQALEWAEVLVGHNVSFEEKFLKHRKLPVPQDSYCTMRKSTSVCKIEMEVRDWIAERYEICYKWPRLGEAIAILELEDQLDRMVGDLAYHDALYDVHATVLLYCKLNDLQLQMDGCKIRTANLFRKYVAVRRYAVVGEWEIVKSLRAKSFAVRQVDNVVNFYQRWRWRISYGIRNVWYDLWYDLRSKHPWLERLTNRNKQAEEEDEIPF
ncbi:MAG: 3'-5' exonuclease [Aquificaceae bacterium]|nr:3'-5' exonuclease [Aquificaceae bacterium]